MSLILDALRKSERTRQQSLTGQLGAGEMPAGVSRMPVPWMPILIVILAVNGLLLFFFWPKSENPVATSSAPALPVAPPAAYHPDVRPLAQEADAGGPPVPAPSPSSRFAPPGNPSIAAPVRAQAPAVTAGSSASASPQGIDSLPADLHQALPALHLDVLAYAKDPADRFVVINLQRFHVGDQVADGVQLVGILAQGAVLEFRGATFLLPP